MLVFGGRQPSRGSRRRRRFLSTTSLGFAAATAGSLLGKTGNDSTSPLSVQTRQGGVGGVSWKSLASPVPPIGTLLCLLAHFLPGRVRRGPTSDDDKVKESFHPPGTPYLEAASSWLGVTSPSSSAAFKGAGSSLQSSHYTTSGTVLSCLPP